VVLDGVNDHVLVPHSADLEPAKAITVSAWVRLESFSTVWPPIVAKPGTNGGYNLHYNESRGPYFHSVHEGTGFVATPTPIHVNYPLWHLLTATFDGSAVRLYVDGVLWTYNLAYPGDMILSGATLQIGSLIYPGQADRFFHGAIDDVRIYDYARNASVIAADAGLVARYPLNGTADDVTGNGNNGTVHGASATEDEAGTAGAAYSFDGQDDYIDLGDPETGDLDIDEDGDFSISLWYYHVPSANIEHELLFKRRLEQGTHYEGYRMVLVQNAASAGPHRIAFSIEDAQGNHVSVETPINLSSEAWHHLVAIRDTAQGVIRLFIDGTEAASPATDTTVGPLESSQSLIAGKHPDPGYTNDLSGKLDEIRVYKRALTETEIQDLHAPGPVGPYATGIVRHDPAEYNTNADELTFAVTFNTEVSGVTLDNFWVSGTHTGATAVSVEDSGDAKTWHLNVATGPGDGSLTVALLANLSNIIDSDTNPMWLRFPSGYPDYVIDRTVPTVTIEQAAGQADPGDVEPVLFTAVFSEPLADFATGDVTLSGTAEATTATVTEVAPNNGTTYQIAVTGAPHNGIIIASIAAGKAHDAAGNPNDASTSTDNEVVLGASIQAVSSVTSATPDGTVRIGQTVEVTLNFAGTMTLAGGNMTVTLDSGGAVVFEPFVAQTSVTGTYTVAAGEASTDLTVTDLALAQSATLTDGVGIDALLELPVGSNLGDSKAIVIPWFQFTKPALNESAMNVDTNYRFEWDIAASEPAFDFKLMLFPAADYTGVTPSATEAVSYSYPLPDASTVLDSSSYAIAYTHYDSFPDATYYPTVVIQSGTHANEVVLCPYTVTFTTKAISEVTTIMFPQPTTIVFGRDITVGAAISSPAPPANAQYNAQTTFIFHGPQGYTEQFQDFSDAQSGALADLVYAPPTAGNWQVEVSWPGNGYFGPSVDYQNFTVQQGQGVVQLLGIGGTHIVGEAMTVEGRLTIESGNTADVDLSGETVTLTLTAPDASQTQYTPQTVTDGHFSQEIPTGVFGEEGEWSLTADFAGSTNLLGNQHQYDLIVRQKRGYAILVHGRDASGQGLDLHENTLNFVKAKLEAAGIDANSTDPDVKWIAHDQPNPEQALSDAIQVWARDKMLASPAPLYVVLVNHGHRELFHMYPDSLTPPELNSMFTSLENSLSGTGAEDERIICVLGMCHSGSFVGPLSKPGRVIIAAATGNELSMQGPGFMANKQGEYFVYLLFRQLADGISLRDSYEKCHNIIQQSRISGAFGTSAHLRNQHPLLDDDGDGIPSGYNHDGDGLVAANIYLRAGYNVVLDVTRRHKALFLSPTDAVPQVWAEVNATIQDVHTMWMEVYGPDQQAQNVDDSSMQYSLELPFAQMDYDAANSGSEQVRYSWSASRDNPDGLFVAYGEHQIAYYVVGQGADDLPSAPLMGYVYRAPDAQEMTEFDLVSPASATTIDFATENAIGIFTWEASQSPIVGGGVKYILRIFDGMSEVVYESPPAAPTHAFITPSDISNGDYSWDVVAVDEFGRHRGSASVGSISVFIPNSLPGFIYGKVYDDTDASLLTSASVSVQGGTEQRVNSGYYVAAVPAGTYDLNAQVTGYFDSWWNNITVRSGLATQLDFEMTREAGAFVLNLGQQWNLISLPLTPDETTRPMLINAAFDNVLRWYDGNDYQTTDTPTTRVGYWILVDNADTLNLVGPRDPATNIILQPGWNLVGPTFNAQLPTGAPIVGTIWGWTGGTYNVASQLDEGKGYWIYSPNGGEIQLQAR